MRIQSKQTVRNVHRVECLDDALEGRRTSSVVRWPKKSIPGEGNMGAEAVMGVGVGVASSGASDFENKKKIKKNFFISEII